MKIEHYPIDKLKGELYAIISAELDMDEYALFFFGSRVAGTAGERSDIDVGISGPAPVPLQVLGRIRSRVEGIPTLYKIDVVDFARSSERFRSVALEHREPITAA